MFSKAIILAALVGAVLSNPVLVPIQHAPQPYKFGYDIKDAHGEQYRQEEGNGANAVKGSYGFTDDRGVKRQVAYVADQLGFRAQVLTNEPGTANQNPAAVKIVSTSPLAHGAIGTVGLGPVGLGIGGIGVGPVGAVGISGVGLGLGSGIGLGVSGVPVVNTIPVVGANAVSVSGVNGLGIGHL